MPGFLRKLVNKLRPKPKVNIPNFKNSIEYFEWRKRTYGENLPAKMAELQKEVAERQRQENAQKLVVMDGTRAHHEQQIANKQSKPTPTKK